jgi:hypothetical protein
MADETPKKKSLSEISHLFLSSVRDNATGGTRPKRVPPVAQVPPHPAPFPQPMPESTVDLTPEELAQVVELGSSNEPVPTRPRPRLGTISAIIASHLNGKTFDRTKEYARHLAADGKRVGIIEVDASEFRVMCFDHDTAGESSEPVEAYDPRQMVQTLEELTWDIDRWLLLLPNPRTPEARALLRLVDQWTLLSTCDHDGVVSSYRAIKGLAEGNHPRLSLALLNATDQEEAGRIYRKIAGVCQQFLNWPMEAEQAVEPAVDVAEHVVMLCRPNRDKASVATAPQWQIVTDFLIRARADQAAMRIAPVKPTPKSKEATVQPVESNEPKLVMDVVVPAAPSPSAAVPPIAPVAPAATEEDCEITDLPSGDTTEAAVLAAVLKKPGMGLVECPVRPPMCPKAMLAVSRDHRIVVLAVARSGLTELRSIGQAYRWVIENRPLLSMALPQFSIDTHAMPRLRLLVDRADLSADILQPMLESGNVTVQSYRKLRWGGKTGLLLEAA